MSDTGLTVLKVKDVKKKEHPLDKTLNPVLPRHPFLELIVAPPKSGKSNLIINKLLNTNFYDANEYWDQVYFISPSQLHDETVKHYVPKIDGVIRISEVEEIMNLQFILDNIVKGQKELLKEKKDMERILIVLDDCVSFLKPCAVLATKYRHVSLSFIIVSQSFRSIPLIVRNCASSVIFFKLHNQRELDKIQEEYGDNYSKDFMSLAKYATAKQYDFSFLNNETMQMFHNYDQLLVDAASDEN